MKSTKIFVQILCSCLVLWSGCNSALDNPQPTSGAESLSPAADSRSAAWATEPVRLVYAQPFNYAVSGTSWDEVNFYVHVKNIGTPASRVVSIHYDNAGTWETVPMSLTAEYGEHSYYSLVLSGAKKEFVVKFESSEGTFWDNNGGANYKVQPWTSADGFEPGVVGGTIGLVKSTVSDYAVYNGTSWVVKGKLTIDTQIENLSYNKKVGVRYSTDNWATWTDVDSGYQYTVSTGGGSQLERWQATASELPYGSNVQFALYYKNLDSGLQYWDSNFTQNYVQPLITGNVIQ